MLLTAIQKFTLLDFPGKISCIAFTPGCNFRCGFCHNPEFVLPNEIRNIKHSFISESTFFNFLEKRKNLLDGVVISGGEPTIAPGLIDFMKRIKQEGFLVKLDTNGNRPEILAEALTHAVVDYIALDIKTSFEKYSTLVKGSSRVEKLKESVSIVKNSGIDYEFRTTLIKEIHSQKILEQMRKDIGKAKAYYLQTFRPQKTLSPEFSTMTPFTKEETIEIARLFNLVETVSIRGF